MTHRMLALGIAALVTAAPAALAGEPATTETHQVKVRQVFVANAGEGTPAPPHHIAVFAHAVNGGDPAVRVEMNGDDGDVQVFDLDEIPMGETRTFTSADGKEVEIRRGEDGVTLTVDGKEIALPAVGEATMAAAPGAFAWTQSDEHDVVVVGGAPHVFVAGDGMPGIDFENLEAVKNLRPGIRDEVVAALKEIMATHPLGLPHVRSFTMAAPGTAAADCAKGKVMVRQVVVETNEDDAPRAE